MRYDMIALHASLLTSVSATFGHAPLGSLYTYLLIHALIAPYVCLGASAHHPTVSLPVLYALHLLWYSMHRYVIILMIASKPVW